MNLSLRRRSSLSQLKVKATDVELPSLTSKDLMNELCVFKDTKKENSSIQMVLGSSSLKTLGPSALEKQNLFNKYVKAYGNYSKLIDERRERLESFQSKRLDTSPSDFLRSKLNLDKDGRVPVSVRMSSIFDCNMCSIGIGSYYQ